MNGSLTPLTRRQARSVRWPLDLGQGALGGDLRRRERADLRRRRDAQRPRRRGIEPRVNRGDRLPGETEGATFLVPAGETIHGHRVVRADGGALFHPEPGTAAHADQVVGIALQSGDAPAPLLVRAHGQITEASWSWAPGVIWCGADGQLTQSPPASGWLLQVARVVSPTTITVDIDTPIFRS